MHELLPQWLLNPTIDKLVGLTIGIILIYSSVRLFQNLAIRNVASADIRYRVRKLIRFAGYVAVVLLLFSTFSEYLGQLAVAFGGDCRRYRLCAPRGHCERCWVGGDRARRIL